MPRLTHFLLVCLTLTTVGLAVIAWQQRADIRRLTAAREDRPATPTAVVFAGRSTMPGLTLAATRAPGGGGAEVRLVARSVAETAEKSPARRGGIARLMGNPEFVRALSLQQEGLLDARFAELFRRLRLSDVELATFKRLLVEKETSVLDVVAVSQEAPEPLSPAAVRTGVRNARGDVENAIRVALGEDRYAVYHEFERTLAERATVSRLEQRLSYTPAPLQPAQAETLVRILAEQSRPVVAVSRAATNTATEGESIETATAPSAPRVSDDALVRAQAVLTPPQVDALRQIQTELNAAAEAARVVAEVIPAATPTYGDAHPSGLILLH